MYGIISKLRILRSFRRSTATCNIKIAHNRCIHSLKINNDKFSTSTNAAVYASTYRNSRNGKGPHSRDVGQALTALATAYGQQGRIYSSNILNLIENSSSELLENGRGLLLLQCCGNAIPDQTVQARTELCEKVWKKLEQCGVNFETQYYNTYLQICIENRVEVNFKAFLSEMKCEPNEETYRLMLDCTCEVGDVEQAVEIVAVMKEKQFPADERLFNALILGHAIKGGLRDAEKVLQTMQTAHVPVSSSTSNAIIRGLSMRKDREEFMHALQTYPGVVKDKQLVQLLKALGLNDNHSWLKEMMQILGPMKLSKENIQQLDLLCINLVHLGQPHVALTYYNTFVEPMTTAADEGAYAFFLLIEMLRCGTPAKTIIDIIRSLQESGVNTMALEKLTGVALKKGHTDTAWELLRAMSNLRPHYFWPLFLQTFQQKGEAGVLTTLKNMLDWGVKPDSDTLEYYCIALCDSKDPRQLLKRLQNLGLSVRELFTPLMCFLLRNGKIVHAANLCKAHEAVVQSERLLQPLVKAWCATSDAQNTVRILQKVCQSATSADYTGQFLLRALKACVSPDNHEQFLELLKVVQTRNLQISSTVADSLMYWLNSPNHTTILSAQIQAAIDNLLNPSLNHHHTHIPHPRDMNVTELENHLTELQNKNMETRGVLRRLIQEHSRLGNENRVNELRAQFISSGYSETAGMKASLLQIYVLNNNVDSALKMYHEIKATHPNFLLDDFKIVDLAHLLVANKQFEVAVDLLTVESDNRKPRGGPKLVRNCWKLISAAANEEQAEKLFKLLVERGYCEPSNIILGPLVKIHLNEDNLNKAVEVYKSCAEKYQCTPLQLELLCALVEGENEQLLQEALNVTSKVHGSEVATVTLIAALAQNGLHNSLRKFLIETKGVPKREIEKRCDRWVNENRLFALETLAKAAYQLPSDILDRTVVYRSIMRIYSIKNDCESAVRFYRQLLEKEETVSQKVVDELLRLVNRCKYEMPIILKTKNTG